MTIDRRKFLSISAGTSATIALAALPLSIRRALAVEASTDTGTIKDVKHIVILMQENRGFDHYFGTMKGVRGYGDRFPVPLESGKPVWFQSNGEREITPFHLDPTKFNAYLAPSTPHSFSDSQAAWNQGKFGNWPKYKNDNSMGYYKRSDIPFQFALAESFTICDSYHCSITSGTDPNRITFFSGSNFNPDLGAQGVNSTDQDSEPNNLRCWIKNPAVDIWPEPGYTYKSNAFKWPTIPDVLEEAGVSWRIYQDPNDNWTGAMHGCLAFESFRTAKKGSPIYENGMSHWSLDDLAKHVQDGTLPAVSWVLPPQSFSEHPGGPSSPQKGSNYTEQVLNALTSNPEVWSKTVFFLTFDENDGQFDHMPPPAVPSYNLDGTLAGGSTLPLDGEYFHDVERAYLKEDDVVSGNVRPFGLSARVPMYVVSPWSKGGWVSSEVFDHTSLAMFVEKRFDVTVPGISPWHRAVCGDLSSAFDFSGHEQADLSQLPNTSRYALTDAQQMTMDRYSVPEQNEALYQERGTRFSRKLPYELYVESLVEDDANLSLLFRNTGSKGVVFHVYDKLHLERIPRRYTVEAGKTLADVWDITMDRGQYDLWVYGPNGFVRAISDLKSAQNEKTKPECQLDYVDGDVRISFHNTGSAACKLLVEDNAYRSGGPWLVDLAPGESVQKTWSLADSASWYDFSVSSNVNSGFARRFAGRVETGKHGLSDPMMGTA